MDVLPRGHPLNVAGYERLAREKLAPPVWDGIDEGAGDERTRSDNEAAFERWSLRPRFLVDLTGATTATTVLGTPVSMPLLVAPTGWQRLVHPEGEVATARASAEAGTVMCVASFTTSSLPEIAAVAPAAARWFQLYPFTDDGVTRSLIEQAVASDFHALVVTVDTPVPGRRERSLRHDSRIPAGIALPALAELFPDPEGEKPSELGKAFSRTTTWSDLERFAGLSGLPIVVKGLLTPEDAELACEHGAAGVFVSNHGGRQLDGTPATLDVLSEIAEAVGDRAEVFLDGGVRRGNDVVKALALGARAAMIGRPALWGLAADGREGVRGVLELLKQEIAEGLMLVGCTSPEDVRPGHVAPATAPRRSSDRSL